MAESILIKPAVPLTEESVECPMCHQRTHQQLTAYPSRTPLFAKRSVVRCTRCSLSYMHPMASTASLNDYYNNGNYWGHVLETTPFEIPTYHHQAKARVGFISDRATLPASAEILDIGAGYGVLEMYLKKHLAGDPRCYAIEPDQKAQQALEKNGVRWENELAAFGGKKFDLVILSHVLEHMNDPVGYLKQLRSYCHENTYLFIEVPNEDFLFKFDLEPHVLFFSPKTLSSVLGAADYSVQSIETCGLFRGKQRMINERNMKRMKWMNRLPFRQQLKKFKNALRPKNASKSADPFSVPDQFECDVYGNDRIWIRCLAKLA